MSAISANVLNRRSTNKVNSGGAFPTLYHRINQPRPPSKQSNLFDHSPSVTVAGSAFPGLSRFFGPFLVAAHLPFVKAGGIGEELSNNIIADLAPFIALFGEQVTKQFMSQSMGITDNIIFATAPLGIITAIVGAIRVGGSKPLTAIIGRARESRSAVEIELMSSTSVEVGELWDGKGVVRAIGAAPIIELIYLTPKEWKYQTIDPETQKIWTEGDFGIYDFGSAKSSILERESSNGNDDLRNHSSETALLGAREAPNLSLNLGGNAIHDIELFAVAACGVMLQLAVFVYAVLTYVMSPWNLTFQKAGYQAAIYTPLMICGTAALVIGMYLCSHIIERSTVEESWTVKKMTKAQAQIRVAWLQQGGEVNGQAFDSYALFPAISTQASSGPMALDPQVMRFLSSVYTVLVIYYTRVYRPVKSVAQSLLEIVVMICLCLPVLLWPLLSRCKSGCLSLLPSGYGSGIRSLRPSGFGWRLKGLWPSRCESWSKSLFRRFETLVRKMKAVQHSRRLPHHPQLSIRTSRQAQTRNQHTIVAIAVMVSVCGFVAQLLGLRGLHWSVTVAQLVATCVMTVLRASIRRNLLHKPKAKRLDLGYELDWMARDGMKSCAHWSVVTWGFDTQPGIEQPAGTIAEATLSARRRLGALSMWPSKWQNTINSTVEAIEESMNFMFSSPDIEISSDNWSTRHHFEWKIVVEVGLHRVGTEGSNKTHLEEISLTLKRTKLLDGPWGPWRAVKSEIEAVLGLWMLHFKNLESDHHISAMASQWQGDEDGLLRGKPILRILGPHDGLERMSYENWIGRQTNYMKVEDIKNFTQGDTKTCDIVIAGCSESLNDGVPVLGVITTTILERISGQIMYSQFMLNVTKHITIRGKVNLRQGDRGVKTSFGLSCAGLTGLVEIVERAGLANTEEAYMSIVPVVSRFRKLPIGPKETQTLFSDIVKATNEHISNGELEKAEWCRLWLLHVAELAADVYTDRKDWRLAGEVHLHLRRESEHLLYRTNHIDYVNQRIPTFCEHVFASIDVGVDRTTSDVLELVGTCMTKIFGEISKTALTSWKSSAEGDYRPEADKETQLRQAVTEGNGFLVGVLLDGGADIEACDIDNRAPLALACISGHGAIVRQLIKRHADINAKDYHQQTPLHLACRKGHTLIVQILLLSSAIKINARDKMGMSSLDLAVRQNVGAVVSQLLFYGAEDLDGEARKRSHVAVNGSEAGVQEMLDKALDLNLADPEYGRTALHWAAWNASNTALELLLENQAN
ncbi:hypothetical protein Q9L58_005889 [Maublancomyces gigas]|uniref:Uncharacterized protein n=1 Tax=Discina gigas TaxID=1032678 RepID=A0ABR3GGU5_9PEZI